MLERLDPYSRRNTVPMMFSSFFSSFRLRSSSHTNTGVLEEQRRAQLQATRGRLQLGSAFLILTLTLTLTPNLNAKLEPLEQGKVGQLAPCNTLMKCRTMPKRKAQ